MKALLFFLSLLAWSCSKCALGSDDENDSRSRSGTSVSDDNNSNSNIFVGTLLNDSTVRLIINYEEGNPTLYPSTDVLADGDAEGGNTSDVGAEPTNDSDNENGKNNTRQPFYNSTQVYIGIIGIAPAALAALAFWVNRIRFAICARCVKSKKDKQNATAQYYQTNNNSSATSSSQTGVGAAANHQLSINMITVDMPNLALSEKQLRKLRYLGSNEELAAKVAQDSKSHRNGHHSVRKRRVYAIEYPRKHLELTEVLGEGNFGQVWRARVANMRDGFGDARVVAVKTNKIDCNEKDQSDLLQELDVMLQLGKHPNVVRLLGCCTETVPYYVIMEFAERGKLLGVLRAQRPALNYYNDAETAEQLSLSSLLEYIYQIANGMEFIASHGIIHRDLAARNILVTKDNVCKIADFGLARAIRDKEGDSYEQKTRGAMPIRWMAPESLYMSIFSTKSDVWSLGILIWEIVTLGSTPYPGMSPTEVVKSIKIGYHMERPCHCHESVYELMRTSWKTDPNCRPTFSDIKTRVADLLIKEKGYIDLNCFRENLYYNVVENSPGEKV